MKAWVLEEIGRIQLKEVDKPQLKENEVLVEVKAAGVCGSDIPRIYKDGAHKMPLIPGHEFSGRVVSCGSKICEKWQNKRVGIYPLLPCFCCEPCREGKHEMCKQYSYLGSRCDGGFADYVAVPEKNLIELPKNVTYEQAAMLEPMAVAVHAMRRVKIKETDIVAVSGLGTIGQLLIMFLKERGIKNIYAIGNKDYQKEKVIASGVPENSFCNSRNTGVKEWIMGKTKGLGVDVFFECVGKNETISMAIDVAKYGGSICMVGNPYTDVCFDKNVYWKILRNQLQITGTWNSSFFSVNENDIEKNSDWEYVIERLKKGAIHPENFISHRFGMKELEEGLLVMKEKKEDYLKVIVE